MEEVLTKNHSLKELLTDTAGQGLWELEDGVARPWFSVRELGARDFLDQGELLRNLQLRSHILQQLVIQGVGAVKL